MHVALLLAMSIATLGDAELTAGDALPDLTFVLTYDDGPDAFSPQLARYLQSETISATFFTRTCRLKDQPALGLCAVNEASCIPGTDPPLCPQYPSDWLRQIAAMGHTVGSHTKDHFSLLDLESAGKSSDIQSQVREAQIFMFPYAADGFYVFRPPYHAWDSGVAAVLRDIPELIRTVGPIGADIDGGDSWCACSLLPARCKELGFGDSNGFQVAPEACADKYMAVIRSKRRGIIGLHDGLQYSVATDYQLQLTRALVAKIRSEFPEARFVRLDTVPGIGRPVFDRVVVRAATSWQYYLPLRIWFQRAGSSQWFYGGQTNVAPGGGWVEYAVDLSGIAQWSGNITGLALNPEPPLASGGQPASFGFDYVAVKTASGMVGLQYPLEAIPNPVPSQWTCPGNSFPAATDSRCALYSFSNVWTTGGQLGGTIVSGASFQITNFSFTVGK